MQDDDPFPPNVLNKLFAEEWLGGLAWIQALQSTALSCQGQFLSVFLSVEQVPGTHLASKHIADNPRGHETGNFRRVVGW